MAGKKKKKSVVIKKPKVTVGDFFSQYAGELKMQLEGSDVGFERLISEPTINRPGLALCGFYTYFAVHRIQVIGKAERSYIKHLNIENSHKRFRELCRRMIPCIVTSRGDSLPAHLVEMANAAGISTFRTSMVTMNYINAATVRLERDFALTTTVHGCMVDVMGMGILIRGSSGSGKSETVLALIRRGASLVADDVVKVSNIEGRQIYGSCKKLGRGHMEVRGLGIIDVGSLFGVGTTLSEKRLDLVVTLKPAEDLNEIDRLGLDSKTYDLLGLKIPHVELPVAPGRDMAQLIEVAALDQKLKSQGHNTAQEFNKRVLEDMQQRKSAKNKKKE